MWGKLGVFLLIGSIFFVSILLLYRIYRTITDESTPIPMYQRSTAVNMFSAIITIIALAGVKSYIVGWLYESWILMLFTECVVVVVSFFSARFLVLQDREYKNEMISYEMQKLMSLTINIAKLSSACLFLGLSIYIAFYVASYALVAYASGILLILFLCAIIF